MGADQSMIIGSDPLAVVKPNRVKRNDYFNSKPTTLADLIVKKEWQKVLVRSSTHPKEVLSTLKVRLYGVDRKLLPLHLACALNPPQAVMDCLLNTSERRAVAQTPLKNYSKKSKQPHSGLKKDKFSRSSSQLFTIYSPRINVSSSSFLTTKEHNPDRDTPIPTSLFLDKGDATSPTTTSTTLIATDSQEDASDTSFHSLPDLSFNNIHNNKDRDNILLQLTPSGSVRQISPTSSTRSSLNESYESPFEYANFHGCSSTYQPEHADDFLPLHIACLFRASPSIIESLIRAFPDGCRRKDTLGMLPIHIVCANMTMDEPNIIARKMEEEFTTKQFLTNLYTQSTSSSFDHSWDIYTVVSLLLQAYPESAQVASDNAQWLTPIEYLGQSMQDGAEKTKLMSLLRLSYPRVDVPNLRLTDNDSNRRIVSAYESHLYTLLKEENWDDVVSYISNHPKEASTWVLDRDYDAGQPRLPIHLACSLKAPQDVIVFLLEFYPEGIQMKEKSDYYPLHIACIHGLNVDGVQSIITRFPEAVSYRDSFGRLPLHVACSHGADLDVVDILLDTLPDSRYMKDYNGHTPLTYVDTCRVDVVSRLSSIEIQEKKISSTAADESSRNSELDSSGDDSKEIYST